MVKTPQSLRLPLSISLSVTIWVNQTHLCPASSFWLWSLFYFFICFTSTLWASYRTTGLMCKATALNISKLEGGFKTKTFLFKRPERRLKTYLPRWVKNQALCLRIGKHLNINIKQFQEEQSIKHDTELPIPLQPQQSVMQYRHNTAQTPLADSTRWSRLSLLHRQGFFF